jgi:hypothetical protein
MARPARVQITEVLTRSTVGRRNRVFEVAGLLDAITALERHLA